MTVPRPFALIRTEDQWRRVAHDRTALEGEVVHLARDEEAEGAQAKPGDAPALGAGLAFDSNCRLYHSLPDEGRVERLMWAAEDPLRIEQRKTTALDLFEGAQSPGLGDFAPVEEARGPLVEPTGLAVDAGDRLFVAESGGRSILI